MTKVTQFEQEHFDIGGSSETGYIRGSFVLSFDYDGTSYTSGGEYVAIFRRDADGRWRIFQRMWNDHRRE